MTSPHSGAEPADAEQELSRDLGFYAVFTTATGTMIGAGIFILPGIAAEGAGPAAALSFLFAGIIASLAALSVCELATAMPKAGGPYYFVSRAMGPLMGTIVGLGAWLALILKGSFALVGLGQYVHHFSPVPVLVTAAVGGALLLLINLVGAKATGILQNVVVLALLVILGAFVVTGLFAVDTTVLRPLVPFGWSSVFATTGVVFISYLGIVKAAAVAEEVDDPGRNLPLGILSSVAMVTVLYVLTMVVVTGVLPVADIIASTAPLADAGGLFLGAAGALFVGLAGILATLSTGNAAILSSSRYPFAMARDALMTPWIRRVHPRFQTPDRSILVTGGVMIVLALVLDVEGLARLGGVFGMLVFSLVNLSVLVLRRTAPEWYRPSFRVPFYPVLPLLGAVAALSPIPQLGPVSHIGAAVLVLSGIGWYLWRRHGESVEEAPILPRYGLLDKFEELRQVQALEVKRRTLAPEPRDESAGAAVVVELVPGAPNEHLLALAAAMARRDGGVVDALLVTEVPVQTPLESSAARPPPGWPEQMRARLEGYGVPVRFHHVLARDRAHAILSFAGPKTRAILMDWRGDARHIRRRGSYVERVLVESPARVAVLKYRGHRQHDRILVATAGGPYASAEVETGDALAMLTGARLTLLMVLPSGASPGREQQARAYLEKLGDLTRADTEFQVAKGDDVPAAILEVGREHDLVVLGATREILVRQVLAGHLVGKVAYEITERSEGSVLVVRDPGAPGRVTRRLQNRAAGWWRRMTGRGGRSADGSPSSDERTRVELFPREDPEGR